MTNCIEIFIATNWKNAPSFFCVLIEAIKGVHDQKYIAIPYMSIELGSII